MILEISSYKCISILLSGLLLIFGIDDLIGDNNLKNIEKKWLLHTTNIILIIKDELCMCGMLLLQILCFILTIILITSPLLLYYYVLSIIKPFIPLIMLYILCIPWALYFLFLLVMLIFYREEKTLQIEVDDDDFKKFTFSMLDPIFQIYIKRINSLEILDIKIVISITSFINIISNKIIRFINYFEFPYERKVPSMWDHITLKWLDNWLSKTENKLIKKYDMFIYIIFLFPIIILGLFSAIVGLYRNLFFIILPFIITPLLLILLSFFISIRMIISAFLIIVWILFLFPSYILSSVSKRTGQESIFKIGKYIITISGLIISILFT